MLQIAALYLAGREWLWPAVVAGGVVLCAVAWSYVRTPAPHFLRLVCGVLKLLGAVILLLCLLDPMWSSERAKPGANVIAVVADNSMSMTLHDRNVTESRGDTLRRMVTGEGNLWLSRLGENFEVRDYLADTRLLPSQNFRELSFDGRGTALGHTLEQLLDHHPGVACTEQMDQTTSGNRGRTDFGGLFNGLKLCSPDTFENRLSGVKIR